MNIYGVLAFDIDGTLTKPNHKDIEPKNLVQVLKKLNNIGYVTMPVTGKPAPYVFDLIEVNGLDHSGIIAENAGVYVLPNEKDIRCYGDGMDSMDFLLERIGVSRNINHAQKVCLDEDECEVVIDPGDVSILTVFTNPNTVSHRWNFNHSIAAHKMCEFLNRIILELKLSNSLEVLKPFSDGGVQVIRKNKVSGEAYSKKNILDVISKIYSNKVSQNVAMFGDGHNDIPAMSPRNIFRITFSNADPELKNFVCEHGGCITKLSTPGQGVIEGLNWLLNSTNFFDQRKLEVRKIFELFEK